MGFLQLVEQAGQEFKKFWQDRWYYSIELSPGEYTSGLNFQNVALTRSLLARCDVAGKTCLDIGSADGLVSTVMTRRQASKVVSVDRNDFSTNINQLREKLSVNLDYYPNLKQTDLVERLQKDGLQSFDIVINSGLLYHVYGPLNSLAYTRSLVRLGGIVVVETAVAAKNSVAMYFNAAGSLYDDPTTFWLCSIPCLDYMLRMLRLQPLDCEFLPVDESGKAQNGFGITRMAVACRAVEDVLPDPDDQWMSRVYYAKDYQDYTDWSILAPTHEAPVEFTFSDKPRKIRPGLDACHLWKQFKTSKPLQPSLDQIRLALGETS